MVVRLGTDDCSYGLHPNPTETIMPLSERFLVAASAAFAESETERLAAHKAQHHRPTMGRS